MSIDPKHLYPFILERSLAGYPTTNWDQKLSKISPRPPRESSGSKPYELKDDGGEDYTIDGVFNAITPRDENNLKLHFPEDRDWAALARQTKEKFCFDGHVYVGKGTGYNGKDIFGLPFSKDSMKMRLAGYSRWDNRGDGTADRADYCVEIGHWERQTGLKYREVNLPMTLPVESEETKTNKMRVIETKYTEELAEIIWTLGSKKELYGNWKHSTCRGGIRFIPESGYLNYINHGPHNDSAGQLIDAILAYQPAPKFKTLSFKILGHEVKVWPDKIVIGCQTISKENLKTVAAAVEKFKSQPQGEDVEEFGTESSTELRRYVKAICPEAICGIKDVTEKYSYLGYFDRKVQGMGTPRKIVNPGAFIDKILNIEKPIVLEGVLEGKIVISGKGIKTDFGWVTFEGFSQLSAAV